MVSGRVSAGAEGKGKGGPGSDRDVAGGPRTDSETCELKMRTPKLAVANLTKFPFLGNVYVCKKSHHNMVILVKN